MFDLSTQLEFWDENTQVYQPFLGNYYNIGEYSIDEGWKIEKCKFKGPDVTNREVGGPQEKKLRFGLHASESEEMQCDVKSQQDFPIENIDLQLRISYSDIWLDEIDSNQPIKNKHREKVFKLKENDLLFNLRLKQTIFNDKALFWTSKQTTFLNIDEIEVEPQRYMTNMARLGQIELQIGLSDKQQVCERTQVGTIDTFAQILGAAISWLLVQYIPLMATNDIGDNDSLDRSSKHQVEDAHKLCPWNYIQRKQDLKRKRE